jgi:hypothetical protein
MARTGCSSPGSIPPRLHQRKGSLAGADLAGTVRAFRLLAEAGDCRARFPGRAGSLTGAAYRMSRCCPAAAPSYLPCRNHPGQKISCRPRKRGPPDAEPPESRPRSLADLNARRLSRRPRGSWCPDTNVLLRPFPAPAQLARKEIIGRRPPPRAPAATRRSCRRPPWRNTSSG